MCAQWTCHGLAAGHAVPGVIHDNVETSKCGNRRLHGRLRGAFICHVKRDRANAVAVFFYQVIKSLRVACCGDESIAGFEFSLRNVSAQSASAANHTLFMISCPSSCTYCLVSDRRSAALNWEGVVPSHVRKAR